MASVVMGICSPGAALDYIRSSVNLPGSTTSISTTHDLDGDGRCDLVAIFQRRILIFFQNADGTFPTRSSIEIGAGQPIPPDYSVVSIAKVTSEPGEQVLLMGGRGIDYLTARQLRAQGEEPLEPIPLVEENLDLTPQPNLDLLDVALDTAATGRREIYLPSSGKLDIYAPAAEGRYSKRASLAVPSQTIQRTRLDAEPSLLGTPVLDAMDHRGGLVQTLPQLGGRWHAARFSVETLSDPFLLVDFNRDQRVDLLLPESMIVQDAQGRFNAVASRTLSRIPQAVNVTDGRVAPAPNLVDFNGDGILDTFRVTATAAKLSPRTDLSVFLGKPDRTFSETADTVLRTRDFAYSEVIPMGDLNGDGCVDCALLHLDFQPSSASAQFKAYMKNGVGGDLRFYIWDKKRNRFPESHSFSHPMQVSYNIYGSRQLFRRQITIDHDMDGDSLPDLVLKTGAEEISVFKNEIPTRNRYSAKPVAVISTAPLRFSSLRTQDLNSDGRADVVVTGYQEGNEDRLIYSFFVAR